MYTIVTESILIQSNGNEYDDGYHCKSAHFEDVAKFSIGNDVIRFPDCVEFHLFLLNNLIYYYCIYKYKS